MDKFHIYNRGAHKEPIFLDGSDYHRFMITLYVANDTNKIASVWKKFLLSPWNVADRDKLVEIFIYCLMPNHFHIGAKEKKKNGIEKFMHKLCTSYSMYFNKKYDHSGTIIQGRYKKKPVDTDDYLKTLITYIHMNPYGIETPDLMKEYRKEKIHEAIEYSKNYRYSSYKDYLGEIRPERAILDID